MAVSIPKYYKAMLDTLAYTEGTLGVSQNGYDILYGTYIIEGWRTDCTFGHKGKDWLVTAGRYSSTAAGRYQFLSSSWWESSTKNATDLNLTKLTEPLVYTDSNGKTFKYYYNAPFTKENQDYLGYKAIQNKVSEQDLITASKSYNNFSDMISKSKLDCTWTSLARSLVSGTKGCFNQAKPGAVVNKAVCQPNGCSSGAEEIYTIFSRALSKY